MSSCQTIKDADHNEALIYEYHQLSCLDRDEEIIILQTMHAELLIEENLL